MIEVAAFMITIGFLASVAIGATASALGVSPKPARKSTLSRVTSSCARRLATSGAGPVVSFCTISIFWPATVSPWSFMYAFIPPSICAPYSANGPENGATMPSLTTFCAVARVGAAARAKPSRASLKRYPDFIRSPL